MDILYQEATNNKIQYHSEEIGKIKECSNKVKTAFKVADILPRNDTSRHIIKMYWYEEKNGHSIPLKVLKDKTGRVYLIVVDGIIKKIGGSQSKGGIKQTWATYCGSGMIGSPSVRTHGVPILILDALNNGSKVELYMITSDKVEAPVKGLFGEEKQKVSIDFKAIEDKCKEDFKDKVGHYPVWNFQENAKAWPIEIQESCQALNEETTAKSKRK